MNNDNTDNRSSWDNGHPSSGYDDVTVIPNVVDPMVADPRDLGLPWVSKSEAHRITQGPVQSQPDQKVAADKMQAIYADYGGEQKYTSAKARERQREERIPADIMRARIQLGTVAVEHSDVQVPDWLLQPAKAIAAKIGSLASRGWQAATNGIKARWQ